MYIIDSINTYFWIFNYSLTICFYIATIVCTLLVIYSKNIIHSILFLILVFINITGILVIIGLDFIALILVILYIGAIAVLFLFINMMLDIKYYYGYSNYNKYLYLICLIIFSTYISMSYLFINFINLYNACYLIYMYF